MSGLLIAFLVVAAVAYGALFLAFRLRRRKARDFSVRQGLMREQAARRRPNLPPIDGDRLG